MKVTVLTAPILAVALIAAAQGSKTPKLEKTQVARTPPDSGQAMYKEYCAVCHGNDGKGNGPAASALKKAPADLSTLTSRNGGKFPSTKVYGYIQGQDAVAAHGSREMPIWGQVFQSMAGTDPTLQHQRLSNLTEYLKTLQK